MPDLPGEVRSRLADSAYRRNDVAHVRQALGALGVAVPEAFRAFYEQYEGPFSSERTGFSLLDLCEQAPNVLQATETCRKEHGWPTRLLVLTELLGNAVLVLDAEGGGVFNVDFEGGDQLLVNRQLSPRWHSFGEFLGYYFG